jgi:hypothetical protein
MPDFRPLPHRPIVGSIRPQDAPRLERQRARLARRSSRRARRQWLLVSMAFASLAAAVTVFVLVFAVPEDNATHRLLEKLALGAIVLAGLLSAVFSLWRLDRTRRATRAVRIRLHQVERRLAALQASDASHHAEPLYRAPSANSGSD